MRIILIDRLVLRIGAGIYLRVRRRDLRKAIRQESRGERELVVIAVEVGVDIEDE